MRKNNSPGTESCPEWDKYLSWWEATITPKMREFYKHMASCPECQRKALASKNEALSALVKVSDEELIQMTKKLAED